ncbi:AAA family ATPase [Brevibacillus marinus]|uniref:AAA family ATPase n=1 Tax=Brevibacillus marinus TaxID=2496837 RepID=UPI000F83D302|nr:hypothetical protein [Brevibacillus marinus]
MVVINASKIEKITEYAINDRIPCEERLDLGGVSQPVILSDATDPYGEVANTLSSNGVPVLYIAYQAPLNLSSMVTVLSGEEVSWEDIKRWIQKANERVNQQVQIASLNIKRTIGVFGIQPGIGAGSIARGLALYSAQQGIKTLYIDLNYRFPKAPYLIGYKGNYLEELLDTLLMHEKPNMENYFLHKSKMTLTKQQQDFFKRLPDDFYVLSPSGELGLEYFPNIGTDLDQVTDLVKKIIDGAKPYFENILISMSSDPDEILNLATLRVCDQRLFVTDTNPSSVYLFDQRMKLLIDSGVPMDGTQVVVTKAPAKLDVEPIEKIIGQPIHYTVEYDPHFVKEINELNLMGGDVFKAGITKIAETLLGIKAEKKQSGIRSWFSSSSKTTKAGVL